MSEKQDCLEMVSARINEASFLQRSKKRPQDFTRGRKMIFVELICFMLGMVKRSIQTELNAAFELFQRGQEVMTQQAFSTARKKVKWEAYKELFQASVDGSYNEGLKLWRGIFGVLASDGTFLRLPSFKVLLEHFGGLGPEKTSPTALVSLLYDLLNNIVIDAAIEAITKNERDLTKRHIEVLVKRPDYNNGYRDLITLDRGYPSHAFIRSIPEGMAYLIRLPKGFVSAKKIPEGSKDCIVTLGRGKNKFQVRILHITLPTGEVEILVTNLTEDEVEYEAFMELYNMRWGIETKYKELKHKLALENFSGMLVDNIKQDFYAMMTVTNILSSFMRKAQRNLDMKPTVKRNGKEKKYRYKVNVNNAVGVYKANLIRVMVERDMKKRAKLMAKMIFQMERRAVPIRPHRKVPRKPNARQGRFHHNHKLNC